MPDPTTSDVPTMGKGTGVMALPVEVIAALLGVVSGLSLFLSIIFDKGYFDTMGLNFVEVPTTIADHVRSALLWVPEATTSAFVYVLVELILKQFSSMFAKAGGSLSKGQAVFVAAAGKWVWRLLIAAMFLVVWADALTGGRFAKYAAVASTATIAYIVFSSATHMELKNSLSPTKIVLLCFFPVITTFVYNAGKLRAVEDTLSPRMATITLDGQREIELGIYRYLDRGVLGVAGEGMLVFYRWEEVKKLSSTFQAPQRVNWLCQSLGVACGKANRLDFAPAAVVHP